jgi:hypothetical protein
MKPDIPIFLAGTEYRLRPTVPNLIRIEDELGKPLSQLSASIGIKEAAVFVKNTITDINEKRPTPDEWDRILDECELSEILDAVGKIVETLAPKSKEIGGEQEKN